MTKYTIAHFSADRQANKLCQTQLEVQSRYLLKIVAGCTKNKAPRWTHPVLMHSYFEPQRLPWNCNRRWAFSVAENILQVMPRKHFVNGFNVHFVESSNSSFECRTISNVHVDWSIQKTHQDVELDFICNISDSPQLTQQGALPMQPNFRAFRRVDFDTKHLRSEIFIYGMF